MSDGPRLETSDSIRAAFTGVAASEPALALFDENLQRPTPRKDFLDFILAQTQLNTRLAAAIVALAGTDQREKVAKTGEALKLLSGVNDLAMAAFHKLSRFDDGAREPMGEPDDGR